MNQQEAALPACEIAKPVMMCGSESHFVSGPQYRSSISDLAGEFALKAVTDFLGLCVLMVRRIGVRCKRDLCNTHRRRLADDFLLRLIRCCVHVIPFPLSSHWRNIGGNPRGAFKSFRVRSILRTVWRPTRIGPQSSADPTNYMRLLHFQLRISGKS